MVYSENMYFVTEWISVWEQWHQYGGSYWFTSLQNGTARGRETWNPIKNHSLAWKICFYLSQR